jgi:hypothetical protein
MIEKALIIAISMYALSFSLLIGQYIFMDVIGITMYSPVTGAPIQSAVLQYINTGTINSISTDVVNVNATTSNVFTGIERAFQLGMTVGLDLFTLMTGTYIFNLLQILGVPAIMILPLVCLYVFLMIRAAMSYFRNG